MSQNSNLNSGCGPANSCSNQAGRGRGNLCPQTNQRRFKGKITSGPLEGITISIDQNQSAAYQRLEGLLITFVAERGMTKVGQILTTQTDQKPLIRNSPNIQLIRVVPALIHLSQQISR
jgi:hypothetical protein